ncbi:MAG: hypothetical protein ABIZ34_01320 [Candidatus Limnocylindrales bacterium]
MARTKRISMIRMLALGSSMVAAGLIGGGSVASAREDDVINTGSCSGSTDWKLKGHPDHGRIQLEFEIDSNISGQNWNVTLKQDGTAFFHGQRTTQGPSGSFEVSRRPDDMPGTHHFVGRAVNPATGEVCRGSVDI